MPQPVFFSDEIPLDAVNGAQLVALANGNLVAIWDDGDVHGQVLGADGALIGSAFTVNSVTAGDQGWDEGRIVAPLANGGFVVVWSDPFSFDSVATVKAQMFDATGAATGGEIIVSSSDVLYQDFSVIGLANGGFVVSWDVQINLNSPGYATDVSARIFDASGVPVGAGIPIAGSADADESFPVLAQLTDGHIVVGVSDDASFTTALLDGAGAVVAGSQTTIQSTSGDFAYLDDIAALPNGGFVAVYGDYTFNPVTFDESGVVRVQMFNANGAAVGDPILVSTAAVDPGDARIVALADGGFFVLWDDYTDGEAGETVFGARFTSAGVADGGQFQISAPGDNYLDARSLVVTADGRLVGSWDTEDSQTFADGTTVRFLDPRESGVTLNGGAGADHWFGSAYADALNGMDGADVISAGAGMDTLHGGAGADTLHGGAGSDTLLGDEGDDVLLESPNSASFDHDSLDGGAGNDYLGGVYSGDTARGGDGDDVIQDIGGGDVIDGGAGFDTVEHGYFQSYQTVISIEALRFVTDLAIPWTHNSAFIDTTQLGAGFSTSLQVTGSSIPDSLSVFVADSVGSPDLDISGFVFTNWSANDTIYLGGDSRANHIIGGDMDETLAGSPDVYFPDRIDTLAGGGGNDTYILYDDLDVIVENANGGVDTIRTYYTAGPTILPDNVENLVIPNDYSVAVHGIGNALDNLMIGSSNLLLAGAAANFLEGLGGADTLVGGAGNDTLDGGLGADSMSGGTEDDLYYVDNAGDVVTENLNEGTDTIRSTIGIAALAANVENLELLNAVATGNGNGLDNKI
ncbi:MAG TPA: calcium-binding protein, partial [Caulobacterales bacterium]|nr:calcium-binding protein [Caulobacterales bacterium]